MTQCYRIVSKCFAVELRLDHCGCWYLLRRISMRFSFDRLCSLSYVDIIH